MKQIYRVIELVAFSILCGCTSVAEIRTHHGVGSDVPVIDANNPSSRCSSSSSTPANHANSIEVFDNNRFWAGYVEFDDEGWLYRSSEKLNQLEAFEQRLKSELNDRQYDNTDFLVVAFVHGWHHNANDTDCNVSEFRAMLKLADERYAAEAARDPMVHPRRIVGVYAAWRGESIDIDGLNVTTVLDRRNAAERVAKGDVRELFAQLRKLQIGESKKDVAGAPMRADRMRTVVVGHSFGGLIAFHGLSPAVLNELTLTKPEPDLQGNPCKPTVARPKAVLKGDDAAQAPSPAGRADAQAPVFPDMLILINPAFEATRFEALHNLMRPQPGCSYPEDRPKLVVVTADNDWATGKVFTTGRQVLTALEAYPREGDDRSRERDSNTHAIGFTERYKTHRLCLTAGPPKDQRAVASLTPPANPDWAELDPYAPVWVVGAPKAIVNGHNGFLFATTAPGFQKPYLLEWLIGIHINGPRPGSPAMTTPNSCPPPDIPDGSA